MTTLLYCNVRACGYNFTILGANYFERAICKVSKKSMAVKKKKKGKDGGVKKKSQRFILTNRIYNYSISIII